MQKLESRIFTLLAEGPATPDEIAAKLDIAWATAQGYLLKLVGSRKVSVSRKGRVNVYFPKTPHRLAFKVPPWTKVRSLEELAEELEGHFPAHVSAADIIERERRRA